MHVRRVPLNAGVIPLPEWDQLLLRSTHPNVFQTRGWLEGWWNLWGDGREPYLLVAEDCSGHLLAVAPLVLRRIGTLGIRELSFLASDHSAPDHMDIVVAPEQSENARQAICHYLWQSSSDWDLLRLKDVPAASKTRATLVEQFGKEHVFVDSAGADCPFLPIRESWQAYQNKRSGNFRQQCRAKRRRFENLPNARFLFCKTPLEVQRAMTCLFRYNPARWEAQGKYSAFADSRFQEFHQCLAQRFLALGWLDLCCLEIENEIVAVLYSFLYDNKVYYYNAGYDQTWAKYSLGSVLMAYHVESAFDRSCDEYDFLRGRHSYKYAWTSRERSHRDVLILHRNPKTLAWYGLQRSLGLARRTLKRHVPSAMRNRLTGLVSST